MIDLPEGWSGRSALDVAMDAAVRAGEVLATRFRGEREIKAKGRSNLVTDADLLAEDACLDVLTAEFPDHRMLSEESHAAVEVDGYTWVVDPLDGTNNFVFGIPFFCVNVALVKDAELLLGISYDPLSNEMFHATAGNGAYLNGSLIQVGTRPSLEAGLVGFDTGYDLARSEETMSLACKMRPKVHTLRVLGSASLGLAYVACGRLDLYFHSYLFPWDVAAGILLNREAGGDLTDWNGRPSIIEDKEFIAGNGAMRAEFLEFLKGR